MPFETWNEFLAWTLGPPLRILLILIGALLVRWVVLRLIARMEKGVMAKAEENRRSTLGHVVGEMRGVDWERRRQRALTTGSLLRNIAAIVIGVVTVLMVMAELGLSLGPLLASAGIVGLALGFGAQALVQDFISGIFMIIEDQYGVGDLVDTGEAIGYVEEVTLRVTKLRDASGVVWFIRNGEIMRIGNLSQGWALASIDIPVSYSEEPGRVIPILSRVCTEFYQDPEQQPRLVEEPAVAGVDSTASGTMTIRIFAKCVPGEQWGVPRDIRQRVKAALDAEGVQGPPFMPVQSSN